MKKILLKPFFTTIVLLILVACTSTAPFESDETGDEPRDEPRGELGDEANKTSGDDYQQSIITLLETFDGILSTAELENELTIFYQKVRPLLVKGQIQAEVDKGKLSTNLERSQLRFDTQNSQIIISFHVSILDGLESNPVSALSEFAGKLVFMDTFLQYGESIVEIYQNPLEYYLAQMDGAYLQTLFLRDFARPLYGEERMGPYENYLLQGLAADDLSSMSLFVWGIDRDIIYSMLGLSTQLGEKEVSLEDYVHEVLQLGLEIQDNIEQSSRLFEESGEAEDADGEVARRSIYIAVTSANTYRSLGSVIFSNALNKVSSEEEYEKLEGQILEIQQIYGQLEPLIQDLSDFRKNYQTQYFSDFVLSQ